MAIASSTPSNRGRRAPLDEHRRSARQAWAPSRLRRFVRHRAARWVLFLTIGLLVATSVRREHAALQLARSEWGEAASVVEVATFVAAGEELRGSVRLVRRPVAMVPEDALTTLPVEGRASVDLVPGELLLSSRVLGADGSLLPAGTVGITIELVGSAALVEVGDLVDVWDAGSAGGRGRRLVRGAVVVDRDDRELSVAVSESAVSELVVAALRPLVVTRVG